VRMAPSSDPAHTGDESAHGFIDTVQRADRPDKDELSVGGTSRFSWHWRTVSGIFGFQLIGMYTLSANGIPAADGGFSQIMMATRRDTEMERLMLKEGLMAAYVVSKELEQLSVRYGRLIGR
jgi:hypothetical protein